MKNERTQTIRRLALPISKNWSNTLSRCRQASGSASRVRQKSSTISPMFWNMVGILLRLRQRNVEKPPVFSIRIGLIPEKPEKERALFGVGRRFAAIQIPKQR